MPRSRIGSRRGRQGNVMVEFAIGASLLFMLMVGAGDFARAFYQAIAVAASATTGSFWGAQSVFTSAQFHESQHLAETDAYQHTGQTTTATSTIYCDCPGVNLASATEVDCYTGTCADYGAPRVFSKTVVEQSFELFLPWPGVPDSFTVNREVFVRVQ